MARKYDVKDLIVVTDKVSLHAFLDEVGQVLKISLVGLRQNNAGNIRPLGLQQEQRHHHEQTPQLTKQERLVVENISKMLTAIVFSLIPPTGSI